ncbi:hypothetical protein CRX59_11805 [Burkholderia thailandensis]|nr:hypothetical protein CRX59_11805 [Burkholderia thailandensis]PNE80503.1 hypothetical protein A8H34_21215 [Burkholderia thailandensis]PNE86447.1 hypothetical protein A8H30_20870 [Burkholderia thailandensis]
MVNANCAGVARSGRIVRKDDCDVADFCHDGVGLIRWTLLEATGMNMDVRDDAPARFPAVRPEIAEPASVDFNNTGT